MMIVPCLRVASPFEKLRVRICSNMEWKAGAGVFGKNHQLVIVRSKATWQSRIFQFSQYFWIASLATPPRNDVGGKVCNDVEEINNAN